MRSGKGKYRLKKSLCLSNKVSTLTNFRSKILSNERCPNNEKDGNEGAKADECN